MKKKIYKEGKFFDENGNHIDSVVFEYETDKFTQTDLKERFWKPELIDELLGLPDKTMINRYNKTVKLYDIERVIEAEDTEIFRRKCRKPRKK